MVIPSQKIGGATFYRIDLKNPMIKLLVEYEMQLFIEIDRKEAQKMKKP